MTLDWKAFAKEVPTPFHVQADFNGDGLLDHAWLLLRSPGTGWGLFVFMGSKDGQPQLVKLDEDSGKVPAQRMGVEIAAPGEYNTACGKGYFDCEAGEPDKLKLRLPAIDFFSYESANSFFWWDGTRRAFRQTWISD